MKRSPLAALTALLAALFTALLVTGTAGPALAHDTLRESVPEKGATVTSVERVTLEFSASGRMPLVIVRDSGGAQYQSGEPELDGRFVRQQVRALPDGAYTIAYRIISSDGHPIEGEIPFTVAGATATATASPSASAPGVSATPAGQQQREAAEGGFPVWLLILVGALIGIGVGFLISARKTGKPKARP